MQPADEPYFDIDRFRLANVSVHQRRPMIAPAAVWCNAGWVAYSHNPDGESGHMCLIFTKCSDCGQSGSTGLDLLIAEARLAVTHHAVTSVDGPTSQLFVFVSFFVDPTLGISRSGAHHDTRRCRLHAVLAGPVALDPGPERTPARARSPNPPSGAHRP